MRRLLTYNEWKSPPSIKNSKKLNKIYILYKESLTLIKFDQQLDSVYTYLYKFLQNNEIDNEIFGLTMTLFHYYTYSKCFRNFDKYKLIISCMFLSAKIMGVFFHIEKLQLLHKKYKSIDILDKEIIYYELDIMNFLGFELDIQTPYKYLDVYLGNISLVNIKFPYIKTNLSKESIRNLCYNIVNDCYRRSFCIVFKPEIIAFVAFTISILLSYTSEEMNKMFLKEVFLCFYSIDDDFHDADILFNEVTSLLSLKFAE